MEGQSVPNCDSCYSILATWRMLCGVLYWLEVNRLRLLYVRVFDWLMWGVWTVSSQPSKTL